VVVALLEDYAKWLILSDQLEQVRWMHTHTLSNWWTSYYYVLQAVTLLRAVRLSCTGIALSIQESSLSIAAVDESPETCAAVDGPALASSWLRLADHLMAVLNAHCRGALGASLAVDLIPM
jgi:hypothetical protein